ncbi:MAG: sugar transferase [Oscillospiraceae bacterium]
MYKKYIKRILDFLLSLIAIVVLSPLMIVLAVMVRIKLGSPVLFEQERVGKDEKIFNMIKFRTMTDEKDKYGELLSDEIRLTSFGKFLRSSSLDELPELFNIISGNLSIIGPRPLLISYLECYSDFEHRRHSVKGGLVPPEVLYNNVQPTWDEQFRYEVDYADNLTFLLDLKILFATMRGLFKRNSVDYGSYVRKSLIEERATSKENAEVGA